MEVMIRTCAGGKNFTCNNKIIGARFNTERSARDNIGHGTHTATTVAGNNVNGASFYGLAEGTARGGVPSARIAAYKVRNHSGCYDDDVLAAFDDPIADGVDVISISLGGLVPVEIEKDTVAIGSFHAMAKGIPTVNSAGNGGPRPGSVSSVAPWILTVAASTIDREIIDKVVLGNGRTLVGNSVNAFESKGRKFPIAQCEREDADMCECLDSGSAKAKIVFCYDPNGQNKAYKAGAMGAIIEDYGEGNYVSHVSVLPSLVLSSDEYKLVNSYSRLGHPDADILKSESVKDNTAPRTAVFSSRGPDKVVPEILKPDISVTGVDILAAYSPVASPTATGFDSLDKRSVKFNILVGTSMSCPHVSVAAAYIKTFHPDWSPAAIKSAIMTTAKPMNDTDDHQIGEFAYGSGQVNPSQAVDPGLVYDLSQEDYVEMRCNLGYNIATIKQISGDQSITCPGSSDRSLVKNTNYPSLTIEVQSMQAFNVKINRTATNVGFENSNYKANILSTQGLSITVEPKVLSFKSLNEKQSFVVAVVGGKLPETVLSSSLVWSDGTHVVRSPIIVDVLKSS